MDDFIRETQQRLARAQSILIAVSQSADFDSLAAGLSLYLSLKKSGKNASIIGPSPKVFDAQNLYAVDKISKEDSSSNLVITIDNAIDKVDKVTHFLDGKTLKLVIHALPGTQGATKEDINFQYSAISPDFIFAIGYTEKEQLEKEYTHEQNISSDAWVVGINKHNTSSKFAQLNLHDPQASSICEITTAAIKNLSLPIDEDIAFNLYAGLSASTQMFSPALSTPQTLGLAQYLIKIGAGKASLATMNVKQSIAKITSNDIDRIKESLRQFSASPTININPPTKTGSADFQKIINNSENQKPIEETEKEEDKESWLKPPKIYRGSKSFDRES